MARERPAPIQVFPCPPVTSNGLKADQKAQLLRSTRKLTDVLGVAPYFLDAPSNSSSTASPDQTTTDRFFCLAPLSPCTPTSDLGTPLSPTFDHKIHQRRQKVAKLSQMFGENVPPSLVFPAPADLHSRRKSGPKVNSTSRVTPPNAPPGGTLRTTSSLADLKSGPAPSLPPRKLRRTASRSLPSKSHQISQSVPSHPYAVAPLPGPFVGRANTMRGRTTSERRARTSATIVPSDEGAWNNQDMDEVRQNLRKLRAR